MKKLKKKLPELPPIPPKEEPQKPQVLSIEQQEMLLDRDGVFRFNLLGILGRLVELMEKQTALMEERNEILKEDIEEDEEE